MSHLALKTKKRRLNSTQLSLLIVGTLFLAVVIGVAKADRQVDCVPNGLNRCVWSADFSDPLTFFNPSNGGTAVATSKGIGTINGVGLLQSYGQIVWPSMIHAVPTNATQVTATATLIVNSKLINGSGFLVLSVSHEDSSCSKVFNQPLNDTSGGTITLTVTTPSTCLNPGSAPINVKLVASAVSGTPPSAFHQLLQIQSVVLTWFTPTTSPSPTTGQLPAASFQER